MLKRKIAQTLLDWKRAKTTQGLMVTGARQVGKTSSIEQFARSEYENLAKVDFAETADAASLLEAATNTGDLIRRITALIDEPITPGNTLLFFDEVQRCGDAVTWMKYLVKDGRFDVVYSGSLLGIEAFDYRSLPVGYADVVDMFPLDFEEFCWAFGVQADLVGIAGECFERREEVPGYLHAKLMGLFNLYVLVGGMPEAVQLYAETNDTQAMRRRQGSILSLYRADIARYIPDPVGAQRVKTIFDAIPAQLNKENKRFIVSGIDKKRRFADMASDFDWLAAAGVALPALKATEPAFPVGLSLERSHFKLYQSDVGLLFSTLSPIDVRRILSADADINFGAVYENAVAQELRAHGHRLAYYNSKKFGEVDFLLEGSSPAVTLLEVKSGKESYRHKALDNLMAVPNYPIDEALVLHPYNVRVDGNVTYLPVYMAMFL